jgi:hypothetical protein
MLSSRCDKGSRRVACRFGCDPWGWVHEPGRWRCVRPCPRHRAAQFVRWLNGDYRPQYRSQRAA